MKEKKFKKIIEEFFEKMDFEVEVEKEKKEDNNLEINLNTEDPRALIGEEGKTLVEVQKILGKILRKKSGEQIFLDLDINQYKKQKTQYLKDLAQDLADEVSLSKEPRALPPLPAYQRRIVHLALKERQDVVTESQGEEPQRRVMIKPAT